MILLKDKTIDLYGKLMFKYHLEYNLYKKKIVQKYKQNCV